MAHCSKKENNKESARRRHECFKTTQEGFGETASVQSESFRKAKEKPQGSAKRQEVFEKLQERHKGAAREQQATKLGVGKQENAVW